MLHELHQTNQMASLLQGWLHNDLIESLVDMHHQLNERTPSDIITRITVDGIRRLHIILSLFSPAFIFNFHHVFVADISHFSIKSINARAIVEGLPSFILPELDHNAVIIPVTNITTEQTPNLETVATTTNSSFANPTLACLDDFTSIRFGNRTGTEVDGQIVGLGRARHKTSVTIAREDVCLCAVIMNESFGMK